MTVTQTRPTLSVYVKRLKAIATLVQAIDLRYLVEKPVRPVPHRFTNRRSHGSA